jgi:hypothetical protein
MGVRSGDSEEAAHLTASNLEKEVIMKHKLQHRFPRACSALVGLIFLCSGSGFGLITEADAGTGAGFRKPWSQHFDPRNQAAQPGYPGGTTSPLRGLTSESYIQQMQKLQEAITRRFSVRPDGSMVIGEFPARNKKGLDPESLRGGKPQSEEAAKIPPGHPSPASSNLSPTSWFQESSPLKAMKTKYKVQGLSRTLKEIVGSSPSPSELRAMVVDDLPDWGTK